MRLYSGPSTHFIRDSVHNQIAEKLKSAFFRYYRFEPSRGEVQSWRNSLRATAQVFEEAGLKDHGVILEYQLPQTSKRLDCMVCGKNGQEADNAVIIELKQWEGASEAVGDKMVTTWVGGASREVLHPAAQVGAVPDVPGGHPHRVLRRGSARQPERLLLPAQLPPRGGRRPPLRRLRDPTGAQSSLLRGRRGAAQGLSASLAWRRATGCPC